MALIWRYGPTMRVSVGGSCCRGLGELRQGCSLQVVGPRWAITYLPYRTLAGSRSRVGPDHNFLSSQSLPGAVTCASSVGRDAPKHQKMAWN